MTDSTIAGAPPRQWPSEDFHQRSTIRLRALLFHLSSPCFCTTKRSKIMGSSCLCSRTDCLGLEGLDSQKKKLCIASTYFRWPWRILRWAYRNHYSYGLPTHVSVFVKKFFFTNLFVFLRRSSGKWGGGLGGGGGGGGVATAGEVMRRSVECDRLRQKSCSFRSVSCVTAREIVRRRSWDPSAI